tara:strand:+ start:2410 stop:2646 length:237 start_codon:yes stop_codon:yes gene_type:complete
MENKTWEDSEKPTRELKGVEGPVWNGTYYETPLTTVDKQTNPHDREYPSKEFMDNIQTSISEDTKSKIVSAFRAEAKQ